MSIPIELRVGGVKIFDGPAGSNIFRIALEAIVYKFSPFWCYIIHILKYLFVDLCGCEAP